METPPPPATQTTAQAIASAAAIASNDTSANSASAFTVLQAAGVPAVTINSAPKVNFTVFSDGKVVTGLALSNVSFAMAKLVPGTNGNPDQWQSYVSRTEVANASVGPNGHAALASAKQATTDPKQSDATLAAGQLVYNPDGYYTYTFRADITNPNWTATASGTAYSTGVAYEPTRTHRVAIQLSYKNAAGATVLANPYFDFTVDSAGKAVAVTDPSKTRKMADVSSCNSCHDTLGLHGGGRVDVQYCVMCHNPGTTDANSGNVLTMATMTHKLHAGRLLAEEAGGENYTIWGYQNSKIDFSEVGFPQDLRNCTKCHDGANTSTPQGDNWKKVVSKEACLTCHANNTGSAWDTAHKAYAGTLIGANAAAKDMTNQQCANCHKAGSNIDPARVHWNQNEENSAKYKVNINTVTYDAATRNVAIKYSVTDPTNGNAAYNLVTSDCTGTGAALTCANTTKFGNLRFLIAYQNMVGQNTSVTEFTSYNNGGSSAAQYLYKGTNDGSNNYTVNISIPADTTYTVATGTARVVSIGQIKEPKLEVKSATDPRPAAVPAAIVNVLAQNTYKEFALTGTLNPRREIVSTEKCNACHGALGATSGSNTLSEAFHGGARNTVQACVVCHDANKISTSTAMTNGLAFNESYQMKRMVHGIHGNSKRTYPFTHGNPVLGAFDDTGKLTTAGTFLNDQKVTIGTTSTTVIAAGTAVPAGSTFQGIADAITTAARALGYTGAAIAPAENYAAEVAWPGMTGGQVGVDCNVCHVNNSYKVDKGTVGSVIAKPGNSPDPKAWSVISPMAASCTACHDSPAALGHVTSFGNASFGNRTQAQSMATQEICADCHSSGGFKGVDVVHGQK